MIKIPTKPRSIIESWEILFRRLGYPVENSESSDLREDDSFYMGVHVRVYPETNSLETLYSAAEPINNKFRKNINNPDYKNQNYTFLAVGSGPIYEPETIAGIYFQIDKTRGNFGDLSFRNLTFPEKYKPEDIRSLWDRIRSGTLD